MLRNAFVICILLIPASMASHYAMATDSCQPVFDALTKVVTTPSHNATHTAAETRRRFTSTARFTFGFAASGCRPSDYSRSPGAGERERETGKVHL